jgi:hypothetical protein
MIESLHPGYFTLHVPWLALVLGMGEEALVDKAAFYAMCHRLRKEHARANESGLVQWYLEPAVLGACGGELLFRDEFASMLSPDWVWQDPFDDCWFEVQNGLEIHAANGRDLWLINLTAPRVLRPASGSLAVQVAVAEPLDADESGRVPAMGGLVMWRDKENYLRLDRGVFGKHDVSFGGCLDNKDVVIGRGRLDVGSSGCVFLHLERDGDQVNAYASADGEQWYTVGHTAFPVANPIQVGVHAIGEIDRMIYPGAHPDGTAIRFQSFHLWHK